MEPFARTANVVLVRTRRWAAGLLLALAVAACQEQAATPAGTMPRPEVSVVTLHPRSVAVTAELPGRTVASLVAEVRPQVNGIITRRLFQEGSEVEAGDVLYEIDPASYQAAYDSAVAALQKAQAAVSSPQAKVDRYRPLVERNAVSQQDLDDALSELAQAQAGVAAALADVETARINLAYTKVTAAIGGRVGASTVTVGALVTANQTTALTTIRQLDPIKVDVTESSTRLLEFRRAVAEGRIQLSGPGVAVRLTLDDGTVYDQGGTIAFLESNVDPTTGTFTVRAEFPNPDGLLFPGMYVRATISIGVAENSFLVPQRAVSRNAKGEATARFVGADGKVEQRVLTVVRSVGNTWLVEAGLSDGDRVVVEGGQNVRAGTEVTAVEVTIDDAMGAVRPLSQTADAGTPAAPAATPATSTGGQATPAAAPVAAGARE